jgi:UDP-N-acetylglucosamine 2-epimerase (non-hydrolysing)
VKRTTTEVSANIQEAPGRRVMLVFGTRPEAIKLAPVVLALQQSTAFEPVVTVTAQHREMLDQVLETFDIVPALDLNIIKDRQTLTDVTVRALERLTPAIEEDRPDAVIVQGDTTTTFVGALAAFYHQVPVIHVEAGLRTRDPYSPYPEEINRRLTTQLTALHLAPTRTAKRNLLVEGVDESRIVVTGNTVIDALLWTVAREAGSDDPALRGAGEDGRRVILVTAHRRESWGPAMESVGRALATIARTEPDVEIVFPIHRNPRVREAIAPAIDGLANVRLVEPLPYAPFAHLMRRADIVLTDSGGIQEEGPSLGKPVLVMRDTTERPEAIAAGTARLIGTDEAAIVGAVRTLLHDPAAYEAMANAVNPYGDGQAARRTVEALLHFFGEGPQPAEFEGGGAG